MVRRTLPLLAGVALLICAASAHATTAKDCVDLPPPEHPPLPRALDPEDLVRLRDIGPVDPFAQRARLFTLSPDRRRAAFQLRRADPARNVYCLAMVVIDLEGGARPRLVDQGGEMIRADHAFRGKAAFSTGVAKAITPRWSPDGTWIAFLKRVNGAVQLWRAQIDGIGSVPLTRSETDVEDFRITPDGRSIVFASRPALAEARAAIEREGLSGFHYDDRFALAASNRPFPPAPVAQAVSVLDLTTGSVREAGEAEAALLSVSNMSDSLWSEAHASDGRRAWLARAPGTLNPERGSLVAEGKDNRAIACPAAACAEASRPWWTADGRVRFLARAGWAEASTAIYEWTPGSDAVRRLYMTDDVLADCVPKDDALLCLVEGSLTPRRLERLDPATGTRQLLFEPNPEFRTLNLGKAERLRLTNRFGLRSIADLVLPVGYRPGTRYPLVVVQYDTRGFLRGGTGDDYPIQAFANRGYAVLSFSRPRSIARRPEDTDYVEVARRELEGFVDRRSIHSSLEAGIRLAIERGIADPARIGVTGMSDGTSTAVFALLNSRMFAAAALSNCCIDTMVATRVGPIGAREFRRMGYPGLTDRSRAADAFWAQISLARNAVRITTPILMQSSDDEVMSALESYAALREAGAPVDLFVFPQEHHVRWQPAHRLAGYTRALDWFDYWLKGMRSTAPERQAELRHWDALKRARRESPAP